MAEQMAFDQLLTHLWGDDTSFRCCYIVDRYESDK
jgi:hypothetical protein